jgi:hypothetical protein
VLGVNLCTPCGLTPLLLLLFLLPRFTHGAALCYSLIIFMKIISWPRSLVRAASHAISTSTPTRRSSPTRPSARRRRSCCPTPSTSAPARTPPGGAGGCSSCCRASVVASRWWCPRPALWMHRPGRGRRALRAATRRQRRVGAGVAHARGCVGGARASDSWALTLRPGHAQHSTSYQFSSPYPHALRPFRPRSCLMRPSARRIPC